MPNASDDRQPTITVIGVGSVDADPDRLEVHLLLASEDPDRQKAFQQVSSRSQKLTKLLDSLEVAGHRRHTTGIDLHEVTSAERKTVGYRAQAGMAVRLESEGPLEVLLARAVKEVGASVGGLNWYLSSAHPAHLEALRRATLDAQVRAQAAAEALRLSVAEVVEIRLMSSPTSRARNFTMTRMRAAAAPEPEPGQLSATAEVEITFRLQREHNSKGDS
ncbi:MAG: SIMPL domain-containing protein [Candidatus Dormiibacterota bacterium]